ncbi:uncharacterized protein LOC108110605 [Drosophila eugracilis]|uniref:uncharacterized protein LOC108110605 n=1 Tax=Drosophila eugracilis TaxID=29029 RepID=UPI001BD9DB35|nr:uncharacterized protein LOC108110605 [Drosophila eugracilis]
MTFFCALAILLLCSLVPIQGGTCKPSYPFENGKVEEKNGSQFLRCNEGFTLLPSSEVNCTNGVFPEEPRFCAKSGCKEIEKPENGTITYYNDKLESRTDFTASCLKAEIKCAEGFILAGNDTTYCNGEQWLLKLGSCQAKVKQNKDAHSTDVKEPITNEKSISKKIGTAETENKTSDTKQSHDKTSNPTKAPKEPSNPHQAPSKTTATSEKPKSGSNGEDKSLKKDKKAAELNSALSTALNTTALKEKVSKAADAAVNAGKDVINWVKDGSILKNSGANQWGKFCLALLIGAVLALIFK